MLAFIQLKSMAEKAAAKHHRQKKLLAKKAIGTRRINSVHNSLTDSLSMDRQFSSSNKTYSAYT